MIGVRPVLVVAPSRCRLGPDHLASVGHAAIRVTKLPMPACVMVAQSRSPLLLEIWIGPGNWPELLLTRRGPAPVCDDHAAS